MAKLKHKLQYFTGIKIEIPVYENGSVGKPVTKGAFTKYEGKKQRKTKENLQTNVKEEEYL